MKNKSCDPTLCHAECCGLFPFPRNIYEKHRKKITAPYEVYDLGRWLGMRDYRVIFQTENRKCPFLDTKYMCKIYDDRPPICRQFGESQNSRLKCRVWPGINAILNQPQGGKA